MISLAYWQHPDSGDSVEPHPRIYLQRVPGTLWHLMQPGSGRVGGVSHCQIAATEWHRILEELPQGATLCGECRAQAAYCCAVESDRLVIGRPGELVDASRRAAWAAGQRAERWLAWRHQYEGKTPTRMAPTAPLHLRAPVPIITRLVRREARPGLLKRIVRWLF